MRDIAFRRLGHADLGLLHEWLQRPHVRRWWTDERTYDEVVAHYAPAIDGDDPTDLYVVLLHGRAAGFVQTYLVADYPEYAALIGVGEGAAGVDVFLADEKLTGRGLGSALLRRFVDEVVFARAATTCAVADPDADNEASLRAFAKAGFRPVGEFVDPDDERPHVLVRRDRDGQGRAGGPEAARPPV